MSEKLLEYAFTQGPWAVVFLLLAVGVFLGGWRLCRFIEPHFIAMVKGHLEMIGWLKNTGNRLVDQQEQQTALMGKHGTHLELHSEILKTHSAKLDEHGHLLKEVHQAVKSRSSHETNVIDDGEDRPPHRKPPKHQ